VSAASLSWEGGRLDGTPWQGIRYLRIAFFEGATVPAVVTAYLNQPVGSLRPEQVILSGGRRLPLPPYDIALAGHSITIGFHGSGDHSAYTIELTDGGGAPLHPFFASAEFRFTIDCDTGDCRDVSVEATRLATQPPAVDLLTKDFDGFVRLLGDWVAVRNPDMADLSDGSFERVLLDLLAWTGDMTSYYQDRVANEAFVDTARQRYSLRQHAVLLGTQLQDGRAPTTVLAFEVEQSGFVPAGLQVRMRTAADEVPVTFTVAARTRVSAESSSGALRIAAFPGATDAVVSVGATSVLLWGHDVGLQAGDRLALVQGSFFQVVTLTGPPEQLAEPGWVADPSLPFDPVADPPAKVTRIQWAEPLSQALTPWAPQPTPPLMLHGNLADAVYGTPRRAVVEPVGTPPRGTVAIPLTARTSVVMRSQTGDSELLRALRVPEWPVVQDDDGAGSTAPAVQVTVSGDTWTRVEHFHASRSYDLHFTAAADEDGAVWLQFGDGVNGREVSLQSPLSVELSYRIGDPVLGNVGLGTLVDVIPPPTGSQEEEALSGLGGVAATNIVPATGGVGPDTIDQTREELPTSLRHGPLQRAVTVEDYANVAMAVEGVGRATARAAGGLFNTVVLLVDPEEAATLDEGLRQRVAAYVDGLRMTGREHVVLAAEYVALEVELVVCIEPGFEADVVRDRLLAELLPGSTARPGYFHPDRLSFGDAVRLGDLLAFVQGIPGIRSVDATVFRPLGDTSGNPVRDVIALGRTKVARLDADPDFPEHGTLGVNVVGLDVSRNRTAGGYWRVTAAARHTTGSGRVSIRALGGVRPDGTTWRLSAQEVIAAIEQGEHFYVEEPQGDPVSVEVAHRFGRPYLRTDADMDGPNNLLSLPELHDA
jgi:hypothetical protein